MTPQEQKFVEEAEAISAVMASPGWKVIQDYAKGIINANMDRLIKTDDATESLRLKADIRAMQWFLTDPEQFVQAARNKSAQEAESPAPQGNEP